MGEKREDCLKSGIAEGARAQGEATVNVLKKTFI